MQQPSAADQERRRELGTFLRSRRERLTPAMLGLPTRGRRRTAGLRREEVAEPIGIGVTWSTWLEQGRAIQVSVDLLENLATSLRLSADERVPLFQLARHPPPPLAPEPDVAVRPVYRQLLAALEPAPAHLRDARWNVVAWNRAESLLDDWLAYPPAERHVVHVVWHHFVYPRMRHLMVNWEEEARTLQALFRMQATQHLDDPWFATMAERLRQVGPEFRQWWPLHEVRQRRDRAITFALPAVGHLLLQPLMLRFAYDQQLSLRILLPAPETDSVTKLLQLLNTPAADAAPADRGIVAERAATSRGVRADRAAT
jgi:hypothetical protein